MGHFLPLWPALYGGQTVREGVGGGAQFFPLTGGGIIPLLLPSTFIRHTPWLVLKIFIMIANYCAAVLAVYTLYQQE